MNTLSNRRLRLTKPLIWIALVLCFTAFSAVTASAASAQATGALGSVDLQKVIDQAKQKTAIDAQINDLTTQLTNAFKQQINSPFLTSDEQTELGGLLIKANPTDADTARITELQAISQKASDDLTTLQQVKDPTPDQTTQLNTLTKQQQDGQTALQAIEDSYRQQLQDQSDKLDAGLLDQAKAAVAEVAQEKGLSVVFDSRYAVYSSNDITDDVIKRLNK